ncbi:glycosyltransferase family 2 protein [Halorubrum halophilum]|uniref:glycosyltransferase family 2 protein n=1 Tax=Halorubrum halophilum TaxID=413816 RepID=UPI0009E377CD|nr:glycosyltransferase family 2 protein [Halorubrum halophilum]
MTSEPPLVSVVIPTYNRPKMLNQAVESALNQTYSNIEILIVDDGSPQQPGIADRQDNQVKYIRLKENHGANVARNLGIEKSNGRYIAFLDDDDRWESTKIKKQVDELRQNPSVQVVYTGQRFIDKNRNEIRSLIPTETGNVQQYLFSGGVIGGFSAVIVEKDVIASVGKPDPDLPIMQDREWWIRLSSVTHFASVPEPLVIRRFGDYEQVGDRHEELRDIAYPKVYDKHKELARSNSLRVMYNFKSMFLKRIGRSAMNRGDYAEARRYLFRSILYNPVSSEAILLFVVSLGGHTSYRLGKYVRNQYRLLLDWFSLR